MRPFTIIALVLSLAACTRDPIDARAELLARDAQYYAPVGRAPAPLVILVSGCGGMVGIDGPNLIMNNYAQAAARAGAYAIIVDSFQPRGLGRARAIATVCTGLRLRGRERAGDIVAAEKLARAHWRRPFTGIILAGWSHGGWSVMELLAAGPEATRIGDLRVSGAPRVLRPDAVALYYPYCGFFNRAGRRGRWSFHGPLLLVTAEHDTMGPAQECLRIIEQARGNLDAVEAEDFKGMTHAFDEKVQSPDSQFVYNAEAAARAEEVFSAFVAAQAARLRDAPTAH